MPDSISSKAATQDALCWISQFGAMPISSLWEPTVTPSLTRRSSAERQGFCSEIQSFRYCCRFDAACSEWPAAGFLDTEIRCFHQPESNDSSEGRSEGKGVVSRGRSQGSAS